MIVFPTVRDVPSPLPFSPHVLDDSPKPPVLNFKQPSKSPIDAARLVEKKMCGNFQLALYVRGLLPTAICSATAHAIESNYAQETGELCPRARMEATGPPAPDRGSAAPASA